MNSVIDCEALAVSKKEEITKKAALFFETFQLKPRLAIIIANENEASRIYVRNKEIAAKNCGMEAVVFSEFPSSCSEDDLIKKIEELNHDDNFHGIIIQLPLYPGIDKFKVLNAVSPSKDVDGFTYVNQGKLFCGDNLEDCLMPATAKACHFIAEKNESALVGKSVLIIGTSIIVGRPTAMRFMASGSTVCVANSKTLDLRRKCLDAEIIVTATGVPGLIKEDMVSPNALVIDVGITSVLDNDGKRKIIGDVDFDNCVKITNRITRVPKGVGLLTVAFLLDNLILAAFKARK